MDKPMEGLTPGRMVHWVSLDGRHLPAIVVKVEDAVTGECRLQVFSDSHNGSAIHFRVQYAEEPRAETWHWIEKA